MKNKRKTFREVNIGDTVYHVTTHNYETKIIKKEVIKVNTYGNSVPSIYERIECKPNGSEDWLNRYDVVPDLSSTRNRNSCPKVSYICTTLEEAKEICNTMARDMVHKLKLEAKRINERVSNWKLHQVALEQGKYNIK